MIKIYQDIMCELSQFPRKSWVVLNISCDIGKSLTIQYKELCWLS